MADAFESWEKDANGQLKVWPLQAFTTALFGKDAVGLRVEIGVANAKPGDPVPALQLVLRADQVRQLADALAEAEARLADARFATVTTSASGNA